METLFDENSLSANNNMAIYNEEGYYENTNIEEDINNEILKLGKGYRRYSRERRTPLGINGQLEAHIDNKNKAIYVSSKRVQYFVASSSNYCRPIKINYLGNKYHNKNSKICGNLGNYYILNAGILFIPKKRLKPGAVDILPLVAYDEENCYKFEGVFSYYPFKC